MNGFLGTRGDFLSDLLILAVAVILPALVMGIVSGKQKRFVLHKAIMMTIFSVIILYVVIYEANLTFLGGIAYLKSKIRIAEGLYFMLTGFHLAVSVAALILGAIAMRKGEATLSSGLISREGFISSHRKVVWVEVVLLTTSVVTGLMVYYVTFIL